MGVRGRGEGSWGGEEGARGGEGPQQRRPDCRNNKTTQPAQRELTFLPRWKPQECVLVTSLNGGRGRSDWEVVGSKGKGGGRRSHRS